MTGGIQLLLNRLVRNSRHHFDVVAPTSHSPLALEAPLAGSIPRRLSSRSHRADVLLLNARTIGTALKLRPDVLLSGHIVLGPATMFAGGLIRAPAVQYLHAKEITARPTLSSAVLARIPAAIAVSRYTSELAASHSADPQRVEVILPGCDRPRSPVPPLRGRGGPPTILTIARLVDRYKGFDVMLRALPLVRARVPDVRWVVVGDGPLLGALKETATATDLGTQCLFAGYLSDQDRDAWLDRAHVFAMPSRVESTHTGGGDGFGIVYLEAGAHQLPSVAGLIGGSADAVVDGVTGLLVDATDHVAVAEALSTLLTDKRLAQHMGEAGARRAEELSWQRMANSVDALLERVVDARHLGPS